MAFNVNCCRIASKILDLGFTKIWDILRPGKTQAGTRDTGPEIRDIPGNTGYPRKYGISQEIRDAWQPYLDLGKAALAVKAKQAKAKQKKFR